MNQRSSPRFLLPLLVAALLGACVQLPHEEPTTSTGDILAPCEAVFATIECAAPSQPHIVLDEDQCVVICEAPVCPVGHTYCRSSECSICLPPRASFPLASCEQFLHSCELPALGSSDDGERRDGGSSSSGGADPQDSTADGPPNAP